MKLFVGNIGYAVTDQEMADFCRAAGVAVRTVKLPKDLDSGSSRGFGFVDVEGNGEEAIEKLDGAVMRGRPLVVQRAKSQGRRPAPSRNREFDGAWQEDEVPEPRRERRRGHRDHRS